MDVSGGDWGDPNPTTVSKDIDYDTKITLASDTDLANLSGEIVMTSDTGSGPFTQTGYNLLTSQIQNVEVTGAEIGYVSGVDASGQNPARNTQNPESAFDGNTGTFSVGENTNTGQYAYIFFTRINNIDRVKVRGAMNGTLSFNSDTTSWNTGGGFQEKESAQTYLSRIGGTGDEVKFSNVYVRFVGDTEFTEVTYNSSLNYPDANTPTVEGSSTALTFASPNTDLQYFRSGDLVQSDSATSSTALIGNWNASYNAAGDPLTLTKGETL